MLARIHSATIIGIDAVPCEVEVDVAHGGFEHSTIVGLPDAAVKESVDRMRAAIINCGYPYPKTASVINLTPADIKKEGPSFDLPIALGMLFGQGVFQSDKLQQCTIVGITRSGWPRPFSQRRTRRRAHGPATQLHHPPRCCDEPVPV